MDLGPTFTVISLITIFANGFSWRKRSLMGILISVTLAQVSFALSIILEGWPNFEKIAMNTSTYDITVAVVVVIMIWVAGYIAGGYSLKKKDVLDDFPGKTNDF